MKPLPKAAIAATLVFVARALGVDAPSKVPAMQAPLKAPVEGTQLRASPLATKPPPAGPAPQNVHMQAAGPLVHTLSWDRLAGINGYNVYLNNPATHGTWLLANAKPLLAESYVDASPRQPGALYRVTALYADGRQGSTDFTYTNPPQMAVPAGFAVAQVGPGQVRLSWQAVNLARAYRVFGSGQPADGTNVAGNQFVISNLADGTYSWKVTADYGGAWQGAGLPVATITLHTVPTARYRVVANGFRVVHETLDDKLSRDGRGDEVYAAFMMFHYDRRSSQMLDRDVRKTAVHGDVYLAPGRKRAGTASDAGGLTTGDVFPAVADPSQRYGAAPTGDTFPFLIWQGPLTEGQDAVIILPTMWESDNNSAGYDAWVQAEQNNLPRLWSDSGVQKALTARSLAVVTPSGMINTSNGPVVNADSVILAFANPGLLLMFGGSYDRPIGLQRTGNPAVVPALARRALVLTREMLESAFAPSGASSVTLAIPLIDAPGPDLLGNYFLYVQVERL